MESNTGYQRQDKIMSSDFLGDLAKEFEAKDKATELELANKPTDKPKTAVEDQIDKQNEIVVDKVVEKDKPVADIVVDKSKEVIVDDKVIEPKEWFDAEEPAVDPNKRPTDKATEVWSEKETKERDLASSQKIEEYDSMLKDPIVAAIIEAKKAGKDVLSVIEELKPIDYTSMSEDQLIKIKFERLGLKDEELKDAVEDFMSNPKWKRLEELKNMRTSLESEQNERLKGYRSSVKVNAEKQNQVFQKYEQELNGFSTNLVGKEINGITITKEIADSVKSTAQTSFFKSLFNEDGTWNAERIFNLSLLDTQIKKIVKTNVDRARNRGKGEVLDSITRPDANITTTRKPQENGEAQKHKEYESAQNSFFSNGKDMKFNITNQTKKN